MRQTLPASKRRSLVKILPWPFWIAIPSLNKLYNQHGSNISREDKPHPQIKKRSCYRKWSWVAQSLRGGWKRLQWEESIWSKTGETEFHPEGIMRTQPQGQSICKGLETDTQKTRLVSMEMEKAKRKTISRRQNRDSRRSHRGTRPHSDPNGTPLDSPRTSLDVSITYHCYWNEVLKWVMGWLRNTRDVLNAPQVCAHLVHGAYFMIIFKIQSMGVYCGTKSWQL